jgi:hypothetical protein
MTTIGLHVQAQRIGSGNDVEVQNRTDLLANLELLALVPSVEELALPCLAHPIFASQSQVISEIELADLMAKVGRLAVACTQLQAYLADVLSAPPRHYFGARLPDPGPTLPRVQAFLGHLHQTINEPLLLLGHEPVTITSAEPGSIWFEIAVASVTVMSLIGGLLKIGKAYFDFRIKQLDYKKRKMEFDAHDSQVPEQIPDQGVSKLIKSIEVEFLSSSSPLSTSSEEEPRRQDIGRAIRASMEHALILNEARVEFSLQLDAKVDLARKFPENACPAELGRDLHKLSREQVPALVPRKGHPYPKRRK